MTLGVLERSRLVCVLASVVAFSCADELEGTRPPDDVFYFPVGLEVSADGRHAYVVNSNFDLRFNSGWLLVVDLESSLDRGEAKPEDGFVRDRLLIPSIGGTIAIQGQSRMYVSHRTDRLISIIDVDGADVSCGDADAEQGLSTDERRTDCDRDHLFEIEPSDAQEASTLDDVLTDFDVGDPYALLVEQPSGQAQPHLLVGQLNRARLNAIEVQDATPTLRFGNVVDDDGSTRIAGRSEVLSAVGRFNEILTVPGTDSRFLAAMGFTRSGTADRATVVHVDLDVFLEREDDSAFVIPVGFDIGGREFAAGTFDPAGRWLYAATRVTNPTFTDNARGALYRLDATIERFDQIDERGQRDFVERPRYDVDAVTSIRGQPSGVVYLSRPEGDLVVVSDLDQDAVYVLDALSTEMPVLARLDVPGGPFALRSVSVAGRSLIVTTLFYDHGIALIDADGEPSTFAVNTIIRSDELGVGERAR